MILKQFKKNHFMLSTAKSGKNAKLQTAITHKLYKIEKRFKLFLE